MDTPSSQPALRSLRLQNWKSFHDATLNLAELTLLIGANASGKSNALEGLKLLGWVASGARLSSLQQAISAGDLRLRGTLADLVAHASGKEDFTFGCEISTPDMGPVGLTLTLRLRQGELSILSEEVALPSDNSNVPPYKASKAEGQVGNVLHVQYNNFARGGKKPVVDCVDDQAVFTQLTTPARFGQSHKKSQVFIPKLAELVRRVLSSMLFLDPDPNSMRGYAYESDSRLRGNGSNLSSVLFRLCHDETTRGRLLEFVRALPEQQVTAIDFIHTPRAEVMVRLRETFGRHHRDTDAPLLSDGTLRVLSIAAALFSVEPGTLVVVEEVDNGVHPSRAEQLLKMIRDVAHERGLRVLITTHNPAMLDALPPSAIPNVTICFRASDTGASTLTRLSDLDSAPRLLAQAPLGQAATVGLLEHHVKNPENPAARVARLRGWLSHLDLSDGSQADGGEP